jgi:hypothetical protein
MLKLIRGLAFVVAMTVFAKLLQAASLDMWGDKLGFDLVSLVVLTAVASAVYFAARKVPSLGWIIGRNG